MPCSEVMAETMRANLGVEPGLSETKMFGGLCFMLHGNMVCGVHSAWGMFRAGKHRKRAALNKGAQPLSFTGRKMGGMVELDRDPFDNDARRLDLIAFSLANAATLPPK